MLTTQRVIRNGSVEFLQQDNTNKQKSVCLGKDEHPIQAIRLLQQTT